MHGHTSKGFTLIELMVVIAVVAILAIVAMPSYRALMDNYRVRNAGEDVISLISNARSSAVKLHREVGVNIVAGDTDWCAGAVAAVEPPAGTLAGTANPSVCNCSDTSKCLVQGELVVIPEGKHQGVTLTSGDALVFNGVTGATTRLVLGEITLESPLKKFTATVSVTPLGQANLAVTEK